MDLCQDSMIPSKIQTVDFWNLECSHPRDHDGFMDLWIYPFMLRFYNSIKNPNCGFLESSAPTPSRSWWIFGFMDLCQDSKNPPKIQTVDFWNLECSHPQDPSCGFMDLWIYPNFSNGHACAHVTLQQQQLGACTLRQGPHSARTPPPTARWVIYFSYLNRVCSAAPNQRVHTHGCWLWIMSSIGVHPRYPMILQRVRCQLWRLHWRVVAHSGERGRCRCLARGVCTAVQRQRTSGIPGSLHAYSVPMGERGTACAHQRVFRDLWTVLRYVRKPELARNTMCCCRYTYHIDTLIRQCGALTDSARRFRNRYRCLHRRVTAPHCHRYFDMRAGSNGLWLTLAFETE